MAKHELPKPFLIYRTPFHVGPDLPEDKFGVKAMERGPSMRALRECRLNDGLSRHQAQCLCDALNQVWICHTYGKFPVQKHAD